MPAIFLKNYLTDLNNLFSDINAKDFEIFIDELTGAFERGSHIFICGNGGSASTASHFACDINKGVSYKQDKRYKMICLNDNVPTMLAYANDVSYDEVFVEQLKNFMTRDDLIIGISGSGNSKNILRAVEYANDNAARTFGICGFGGGKLKNAAQKALIINSTDMQKVEDLHMIIFHCAMQWLNLSGRIPDNAITSQKSYE